MANARGPNSSLSNLRQSHKNTRRYVGVDATTKRLAPIAMETTMTSIGDRSQNAQQ